MKIIKRILATLMTVVMILTAIPFASSAGAMDLSSRKVGDTITFGSYPQSKVTDSATLTALDNISKSWVSYGYYTGTYDPDIRTGSNFDGQMKPSDYMKYCDISYNGNKYRAVTFSQHRPNWTGYTSSSSDTYQENNGYYTGNVYYFRYDPLTWRVLDPAEGFVMCTTAIDAQAYNNYILYYDNNNGTSYDDFYGNSTKTCYASDWANSSLRAWLNDDFYNTAFTSTEKLQIGTTYNENKSTGDSKYDSANTSDKIFLLSYYEATNSSYGLNTTTRQLKSTDYAKCQGCGQSTSTSYYGNSWWRLRSPGGSGSAARVDFNGYAYNDYGGSNGGDTSDGIVPAFKFNPKSSTKLEKGDINGDSKINSSDALLTLQHTVGKITLNASQQTAADVNKDSKVNSSDALMILQYTVGKINKF